MREAHIAGLRAVRFYVRGLSRRELARWRRMTPEERRGAVADALAGLELDEETRRRLERAWRRPA